jgi:hypothetical protein
MQENIYMLRVYKAGLETSGWKNKLFFVFVFFSWDFDGWKIHLCKLEL